MIFSCCICMSVCYTMAHDETANGNDVKVEVTASVAAAFTVQLQGQLTCSDRE